MSTLDTTHTYIMEGVANENKGLIVPMPGMTEKAMFDWQKTHPWQYIIIKEETFEGGIAFMVANNQLINERRLALKTRMLKEGNLRVYARL